MADPQETQKRQETVEAVGRLQSFDVTSLPRERELGTVLNFASAVDPAEKLIGLYQRISPEAIGDLPLQQLDALCRRANDDLALLKRILDFQPGQPQPVRDQAIRSLDQGYQAAFAALHPWISYSASKSTDFQGLETQARVAIRDIRAAGDKLAEEMRSQKEEAASILAKIRQAAAEQGVSQQASYFRAEAEDHRREAERWQQYIIWCAVVLVGYSVATLFLHKVPWIRPENAYETAQLAISKVLIFAVLSFMLYLATRNYLAHRHNAVVNKHRQNALLTYEALVKASADASVRETVLSHASACIYAPQDTGYADRGTATGPAAKSVVEMIGGKAVPGA